MDLKKYIYGHCVSPVRTRIYDAYSGQYIYRLLPCGKCLHCTNTRINEWCTRLTAQRKYCKFVYYISLDYAPFDLTSPVGYNLAKETAACYHDLNCTHSLGMHPLVLCKNHLQDFYKRLRKNTNIKLQYFACGEYGMHANGRGYGRPHFHNIIFTNEPISQLQFEDAWTIDGYKIGRVDFQDISAFSIGSNENSKIFRYVCKYLQKTDFDFVRLATIDFHRTYFQSINLVINQNELFKTQFDTNENGLSWKQYIKLYSPFIVCSRRPAIGSAYLMDNLERFKTQDFRLFGLQGESLAFPRYYVRRTKEALCPFRCIGEVSQKPSSSARLATLVPILHKLLYCQKSMDYWREDAPSPWRIYQTKNGKRIKLVNLPHSIACDDLHFYDAQNKFFYQFNGYSYNVWAKLSGNYSLIDNMDVSDVLSEISPSWDNYYHNFIKPFHDKQVLNEKELYDSIYALYKETPEKSSVELFQDEVYARYKCELALRYKTKLLMQNSKTSL